MTVQSEDCAAQFLLQTHIRDYPRLLCDLRDGSMGPPQAENQSSSVNAEAWRLAGWPSPEFRSQFSQLYFAKFGWIGRENSRNLGPFCPNFDANEIWVHSERNSGLGQILPMVQVEFCYRFGYIYNTAFTSFGHVLPDWGVRVGGYSPRYPTLHARW